jgi:hypothetical protein
VLPIIYSFLPAENDQLSPAEYEKRFTERLVGVPKMPERLVGVPKMPVEYELGSVGLQLPVSYRFSIKIRKTDT